MEFDDEFDEPAASIGSKRANNQSKRSAMVSNSDYDDFDLQTPPKESTQLVVASRTGEAVSPEFMRLYYARLFPFNQMYRWLSYSNGTSDSSGSYFERREFSFALDQDEIYVRYQSFSDANELSSAIMRMQPSKIDIGAVFTFPPKNHTAIKPDRFHPVERELVFDIDLTDYDDVRSDGCGCSGSTVCKKCWVFMNCAVKILTASLNDDFGFKQLMWVYSGRRGVHCWICDPEARSLSNDARCAIVDYLTVVQVQIIVLCNMQQPSENQGDLHDMVKLHPGIGGFLTTLHPFITRSFDILEPIFSSHIITTEFGQGLFETEEKWSKVLASMPTDASGLARVFKDKWKSQVEAEQEYDYEGIHSTPQDRWNDIRTFARGETKHLIKAIKGKPPSFPSFDLIERWCFEIVYYYSYPRLDANVSKMQNHLLKSPFCIHPKTGRVCVPFNPRDIDSFDPFQVPTLRELCRQLDDPSNEGAKDGDKTNLKEYVDYFEASLLSTLSDATRKRLRKQAEEQAAFNVDF